VSTTTIKQVKSARIAPGLNDRKTFKGLSDLAESIRANGLAQAPTVRPVAVTEDYLERYEQLHGHRKLPKGGKFYEIVAGERRTRAMVQVLSWDTIPCITREMDDDTAAAIMLAENTSREDLNPIEEAMAYQRRMAELDWSVTDVADKAGVSAQRVRDRVKLLELADDIQELVAKRHFPLAHAGMLVGLDINRQRLGVKAYNRAKSMPVSRFQDIVNKLREEQAVDNTDTLFDMESYIVELVADDADAPAGGKNAQTGAPTNTHLPPVKVIMKDNVGQIMDRYIAELLSAGHQAEAAAVGTLYNVLVSFKWTTVPAAPCLDNKGAAPVGDGHSEVLR